MIAAAVSALLLGGLVGCGSGDREGQAADSGGDGRFPITVPGKLGPAKVLSAPKRVVAMDWTSADIAVSLGVRPVAIASVPDAPGGIEPWTAERLGGQRPKLFDTSDGDPVEKVASYHPDLIVAAKDYNLKDSYSKLSAFAPVVHYERGPNTDNWEESTRLIGKALGVPERAERVLAGTRARIERAREALPALRDKRFNFLVSPRRDSVFAVNSAGDVSADYLGKLGMRLSEPVRKMPTSSTPGRTRLSYELLDRMNTDVLFATGKPAALESLARNPVFARMPAVRAGRYIPLGARLAQAVAFPSPGSLDWATGRLRPKLAKLRF